MTRKKANPADSLGRFIFGVYDYYHDRGMPQKTAKGRMIDDTLATCTDIMNKEQEIPDHMLVIMAQYMSRSLSNRGIQITRQIGEKYPKGTPVPDQEVVPLRDIKELVDATDRFIENYKGWEKNGSKEEDERRNSGN